MSNEYEVYRTTTLGLALQETLDDMIQSNQLKKDIALRIFKEYDKSINKALRTRVNNKINFKSKLDTYRNCDNVWTLLFNGIEITFPEKNIAFPIKLDPTHKIKVVACEAKPDKKSSSSKNQQQNLDE